ncbi:MAG: hypothetical protein COB98_05275 [Flavobacteriaceae bacterium]|nr:MAG: hypothetical protein COB98_05275 [Flavobacteriaceae bacterium]
MHSYIILPGLKLVIQLYTGSYALKEAIDSKETILNDSAFKHDFKFLIDVSKAKFELSDSDRIFFSEYIKKLVRNGIHGDTTILTHEPNQVANVKLIDQLVNADSDRKHGIYSTLRNSVAFLKYNKQDYIRIKAAIVTLKQQLQLKEKHPPIPTHENKSLSSHYRHQILPKEKLIVQCHINHVDFEETKAFKKRIYGDKLYQPGYKNLIDMTNATLNFTPSESRLYADFLVNNYRVSHPEKTAIISTVPLEVAKSFLIKSNLGKHAGTRKIFNSVDLALEWLGFQKKHFDIIKNTLKKLNTY